MRNKKQPEVKTEYPEFNTKGAVLKEVSAGNYIFINLEFGLAALFFPTKEDADKWASLNKPENSIAVEAVDFDLRNAVLPILYWESAWGCPGRNAEKTYKTSYELDQEYEKMRKYQEECEKKTGEYSKKKGMLN